MPVTHVATTTNSDFDGVSLTVTKPAGIVAGNLLVAYLVSPTETITPPSGWSLLFSETDGVPVVRVYYKVAGGSEPTSYTFTGTLASIKIGVISGYSGVDTSDPWDFTPVTAVSGSHSEPYTTPSVTAATAGRLLYFRASQVGGSTPISYTASATQRADLGRNSGGVQNYSLGVFEATSDYTTPGTKSGLAITATPTEAGNVVGTMGIRATSIPATFDFSVPSIPETGVNISIEVSLSTEVLLDAAMPVVDIQGLGEPIAGTVDTVVTPIVSLPSYVWPTGVLDATVVPVMDSIGETRRFTGNVVIVEEDPRWLIIRQDGIEVVSGRGTHRESSFNIELELPDIDINGLADISAVPITNFGFPNPPKIHIRPHPHTQVVPVTTYDPERVLLGLAAGEVNPSVDAFDAKVRTQLRPELVSVEVTSTNPKASAHLFVNTAIVSATAKDAVIKSAALVTASVAVNNPSVSLGILPPTVITRIGFIKALTNTASVAAFQPNVVAMNPIVGSVVAHDASIAMGAAPGYALAVSANAPMLMLPTVNITAKKVTLVHAQTIGDGSTLAFTITHNFGTRDVLTAVYEAASPYEEVQPTSIERTTTDTVTVTFPSAPSTNQYRVVVIYG